MAQERTILHCDMNCFYASCEMAYHPELHPIRQSVWA